MLTPEARRAVAAAMAVASEAGLTVDDAVIVHDSNNLVVRLMPANLLARIAPSDHQASLREIELAQELVEVGAPVAALASGVDPKVFERDGFAITFWTYYEQVETTGQVSPTDYASALRRLHDSFREIDLETPHFTNRVEEAELLVTNREATPMLTDSDRALLFDTLKRRTRAIVDRSTSEQILHGEPHPGNLLNTRDGLLFVDLETTCRGPIEFDLAHVPVAVSDGYTGADREMLRDCQLLVLAMVAAWRWDRHDQFPNGREAGEDLLRALRDGPPWLTADVVMHRYLPE
jgi:aminoglycoside phosphotransferase (APT) family kinase protein